LRLDEGRREYLGHRQDGGAAWALASQQSAQASLVFPKEEERNEEEEEEEEDGPSQVLKLTQQRSGEVPEEEKEV